jgi:putative membrane protein insertion efficiency factor
MSWTVRLGVTLVRAYQLALSPFSGGACRFHPTCSEYAMEAITTHGLARGSWLAIRRVSRCHPFGRHGFDPVPPRVG